MRYEDTYETRPELWDLEVSYLAKVMFSDDEVEVFASGWHRLQAKFEYDRALERIGTRSQEDKRTVKSFELELVLNGDRSKEIQTLERILDYLDINLSERGLGGTNSADLRTRERDKATKGEYAKILVDTTLRANHRISANKVPDAVRMSDFVNDMYVDLKSMNMPASGDRRLEVRSISRWSRIFAFKNGVVTIYAPLSERDKQQLRWPHYGIWLNRGGEYYDAKAKVPPLSVCESIVNNIKYSSYNADNFFVEFDRWRDSVAELYTMGELEDRLLKLRELRKQFAVLSEFATGLSSCVRNVERKLDRNSMLKEKLSSFSGARSRDKSKRYKRYFCFSRPQSVYCFSQKGFTNFFRDLPLSDAIQPYVDGLSDKASEAAARISAGAELLANANDSLDREVQQLTNANTINDGWWDRFTTVVLTIPALLFSFFAMNMASGFKNNQLIWWLIFGILAATLVVSLFVGVRRRNKNPRRKLENKLKSDVDLS